MNDFDLVTLTPVDPTGPGLRFHLVGDDTLAGGTARWDTVERPRRKSATEWVGMDPYTLTLPLMSDGMDDRGGGIDHDVEGALVWLASWAGPSPSGIPPLLVVDGPVKVPAYRPRWVIAGIDWDDAAVRGTWGGRIQQRFTVTLLEHTAARIMLGPAAAVRAERGIALAGGAGAAGVTVDSVLSSFAGLFKKSPTSVAGSAFRKGMQ